MLLTPKSLFFNKDFKYNAAKSFLRRLNITDQGNLIAAFSCVVGYVMAKDFDVFLCCNSEDRETVKEVGQRLTAEGLNPWLDEWCIKPGSRWQKTLADLIGRIKSAAVFTGQKGSAPWQDLEIEGLLIKMVKQDCTIIPVILADCVSV